MTVLVMMLAGAGGAIARYGADLSIQRRGDGSYPWGTFWINVSGSLLLGLITGWVNHHPADTAFQTIAGTGFCGAFTTFSAFGVESVRLIETHRYGAAARYVLMSATVGGAAAALGLAIAS